MAYTKHLFKSEQPRGNPISFRLPVSIDAQIRSAAAGDLSGWLCQAAIAYLHRSIELDAVAAELERPWTSNEFRLELRRFLIANGTQMDHGTALWQICQEEAQP
ncbi:hypothetical protein QGP82_23780 [Leptothoe sp. LEGE 181152]|nr:hypothetical protein [Leptothoe sp. LEGE 181152]